MVHFKLCFLQTPYLLRIPAAASVYIAMRKFESLKLRCVDISEKRNSYINLCPSSLSNISGESSKPWMRIDDAIPNILAKCLGSTHWDRRNSPIVSLRPNQREGRDCGGNFIVIQNCQNSLSTQTHVSFDSEQVCRESSIRAIRSSFHHPSPILRNPMTSFCYLGIRSLLSVQFVHNLKKARIVSITRSLSGQIS